MERLKLENGEVVEVSPPISSQRAGPSPGDWQTFVVSPRAKAKIRQWFAKERREEALEAPRLDRSRGAPVDFRCSGSSMARRSCCWRRIALLGCVRLYAAVGEGHVSPRHVVRLLAQLGAPTARRTRRTVDPGDHADAAAHQTTPASPFRAPGTLTSSPVLHARTGDQILSL